MEELQYIESGDKYTSSRRTKVNKPSEVMYMLQGRQHTEVAMLLDLTEMSWYSSIVVLTEEAHELGKKG
jgi:hypothetical protein